MACCWAASASLFECIHGRRADAGLSQVGEVLPRSRSTRAIRSYEDTLRVIRSDRQLEGNESVSQEVENRWRQYPLDAQAGILGRRTRLLPHVGAVGEQSPHGHLAAIDSCNWKEIQSLRSVGLFKTLTRELHLLR